VADDAAAHVAAVAVVGGAVDVADGVEAAVDCLVSAALGDEAAAGVVLVLGQAEAGVIAFTTVGL
jgi:hypothetical protein